MTDEAQEVREGIIIQILQGIRHLSDNHVVLMAAQKASDATLSGHIKKEDGELAGIGEQLEKGRGRMEAIEQELRSIAGVVKMADGFLAAMKYVGVVASLLLSVFIWIMLEKNDDIKAMQLILNTHSVQIDKTIAMLEMTIQKTDERHRMIDAAEGPNHGHARNGKGK